jgi:hypothetical protein
MLESQGAVLALTSPADLVVLQNRIELRDFIIDNAASIFHYATSIRKLDNHGESLYIVTGCIKSDSWALAAYNGLIDPRNDVLRLVRKGSPNPKPAYGWTTKGTAEARSGSSQSSGDHKDQCLFLQGFKMAFSPAFHSKMAGDSKPKDSRDGGAPDSDTDEGDWRGGGNSSNQRSSKHSSTTRGGASSVKTSLGYGLSDRDEALVESFPKDSVDVGFSFLPH